MSHEMKKVQLKPNSFETASALSSRKHLSFWSIQNSDAAHFFHDFHDSFGGPCVWLRRCPTERDGLQCALFPWNAYTSCMHVYISMQVPHLYLERRSKDISRILPEVKTSILLDLRYNSKRILYRMMQLNEKAKMGAWWTYALYSFSLSLRVAGEYHIRITWSHTRTAWWEMYRSWILTTIQRSGPNNYLTKCNGLHTEKRQRTRKRKRRTKSRRWCESNFVPLYCNLFNCYLQKFSPQNLLHSLSSCTFSFSWDFGLSTKSLLNHRGKQVKLSCHKTYCLNYTVMCLYRHLHQCRHTKCKGHFRIFI